jgi:hypothetical protein
VLRFLRKCFTFRAPNPDPEREEILSRIGDLDDALADAPYLRELLQRHPESFSQVLAAYVLSPPRAKLSARLKMEGALELLEQSPEGNGSRYDGSSLYEADKVNRHLSHVRRLICEALGNA